MKKHSSKKAKNPEGAGVVSRGKKRSITIGMDLGDKTSRYCVLEGDQVVKESSVATSKKGLVQVFGSGPRCRIARRDSSRRLWPVTLSHRERRPNRRLRIPGSRFPPMD